MRRSTAIFAFLALALLGDCAMAAQPAPLGAPDYAQFEKTIAKYPYHASPERAAKIRRGLALVKKCMSKAEIRALLGTPDYGEQAYGPKGPHEKWLGSSWMYYLAKQGEEVNLNDVTVEVFFDTDDRAGWIVPAHIGNAKEIGSPDETCSRPVAR